ncbi:MAG: cell wall-binding repeat-containing protein [Peptostreptococcus sp.]|uniref:cell wall-binding repeat-containing protein n=1 Tax=Peptostreptococcus sp. TaxID=1262 RepID=UPI002FC6E2F8
MKKISKKIPIFALASLLLFSMNATSLAEETANENVERISGKDRYETSLNITKYLRSSDSDVRYCVIAGGESFPDALSAGFLASEYDSPLMLTKKSSISEDVLSTLGDFKFPNVFLIGGENTISKKVEKTINPYSQMLERISGENRYKTSELVNSQLLKLYNTFGASDVAGIYNGKIFADALSAVPFMHTYNVSNTTKLPLIAVDTDTNRGMAYMVFGGESSVPKNEYEKYRLAGSDRYKTAVEVAKAYKSILNKDIDTIVLTSGEDFPDALCAGPLAAKNNAAVLLTNSNHLNKDTKEYIQSNKNIKKAIIVGGENSVSEAVEKELNEIIN